MRKQQDELRARFTVFIQHVIIHARISYLRQIQKTAFEISFSEIKNTPAQDFDTQYKEFMTDRLNFNFEEDILAKAFSSLPLMKKKIIKLAFLYDYSPAEIAQKLHCPIKYVYDQKYLAIKKLQKIMKENCHDKK